MMMTKSGSNVRAAILLFAVAALLLGAGAAAFADDPAPRRGQAKFETEYMAVMIDHHASAVEMAKLCAEKAAHEELVTICEAIVAAQTDAIETMQQWLEDWYDTTHGPRISEEDRTLIDHLQILEGEKFETFFMQHMIVHHRTPVRAGSTCEHRAYHDELQDMCQEAVVNQVADVIQLHSWLCEWYDLCDFRHQFLSPEMSHA